MTQFATTRSLYRTLPGHIYSPIGERETESLCAPFVVQVFTFTVSAAPDPVTAGTYSITVQTPANGAVTIEYVADGTETPTEVAAELAAAGAANAAVGNLYTWTSAGAVVTARAKSANLSLALPVTAAPAPSTLTAAQPTPASAPSLRMGLWYVYGAITVPLAITGTPRGARPAALPAGATIAQLQGVLGRPTNQTTLAADYVDALAADQYRAGQVMVGLRRGEIAVQVDPASGTFDSYDDQVHVVVAAGLYSVIGAVADAADGGNTVRVDNAPAGNVLAKVSQFEETLQIGGFSTRLVPLRINRTLS